MYRAAIRSIFSELLTQDRLVAIEKPVFTMFCSGFLKCRKRLKAYGSNYDKAALEAQLVQVRADYNALNIIMHLI